MIIITMMNMCMYKYIYRERERKMYIYIYIYDKEPAKTGSLARMLYSFSIRPVIIINSSSSSRSSIMCI